MSGIPRRPAGLAEPPLSYGQEQLWFLDRFAPGQAASNIPFAVRISGCLDAAALGRAADALVARHEVLRTRLVAGREGRPVQVIDPPPGPPVELTDLSALAADERRGRLDELADADSMQPFALAEGPLLRWRLVRLADAEHVLLVVVHQAVFDGWSAGVFLRELTALYAAEVTGEPPALAEFPAQFADYAVRERDRLQGPALAELEEYWRTVLADYPVVQFPTDRPRPALDSLECGVAVHQAGRALLDGLRELSGREGVTPFVTLLAGLLALLARYTGQDDLIVGTVSAGRGRGDLAPLIGFLVNALPVRADASGDPRFTELMARAAEAVSGAYAHQDLPFGKLVETLGVERDPSRAPVFQIALSYAERRDAPVHAAGADFARAELHARNSARLDLDFMAEGEADGEADGGAEGSGGLRLGCRYKTALFDPLTVQRLLTGWEVLLAGAVADPLARLSELPVLTPAELRREVAGWNDTAAVLPVVCVHELVEAQAARAPEAVAVRFEAGEPAGQRLSYAELNGRANRIARRLRAAGVGPEVLVGVCMATGLDRLAAVLGVWKAGGGYVPLDPGLPAGRLAFMIAGTGMRVIVTDAACAGSVPAADGVAVVSLDEERDAIGALDGADLAGTGVTPSNVAYVIYTSGSTGEPKGVVVEHRSAVNFLQGMQGPWRIGPDSVVLAFAAFSFDVSVCDMFLPLAGGGTVVLAAPETLHSPPRLAALMREAGVTFATLPPAVLSLLGDQEFPALRTLLSAGEELVGELVRPWLRAGLELWNGYGPTEATLGSTFMRIDAATPLPPPIGRPKPNYQAYVLDGRLNPVPAGVVGELHIGGAGVSRGYLNRPGLTGQKFIADPFSGRPGARLYRTGDLARRRPDGTLVFAGRVDAQVKIRGLRVELGEIETALAGHPAVANAAVTVVAGSSGEPQLAGYLLAGPGAGPGAGRTWRR